MLNVKLNAIGTDSLHENQSLTWLGRLRQIEHPSQISLTYSLDEADALDTDEDRLADTYEEATGLNPFNEDSDGDGVSDREEAENSSNSSNGNS